MAITVGGASASDEEEVHLGKVSGGSGEDSSSGGGGNGGDGGSGSTQNASNTVQDLLDFVPKASKFEASLLEPLSLLDASTDNIEPFGDEYSKLQQALRKSHESENRFINKCKTLIKQIRSSSHKLTALSSLHTTDLKKKDKYKEDIKNNRAAKQEALTAVAAQRELIKGLQDDIKNTGLQLEDSSNDSINQQKTKIEELEGEVGKFTAVRDKKRVGLTKIRSRNIELYKQLQDVLDTQKKGQDELDLLDKKIRETQAISSKETRRKAELERQMNTLQNTVVERGNQIQGKKDLLTSSKTELLSAQKDMGDAEAMVESQREEYDQLSEAARNLNEVLVLAQEANEKGGVQLKKANKEVEEQTEAARQAKLGADKKRKTLDIIRAKVKEIEEETRTADDLKQDWNEKLRELKELQTTTKGQLNTNSKQMDAAVREREVLSQNHMGKLDAIKGKELALKIKRATLKNVKSEYQTFLVTIRDLTKVIEGLNTDRAVHESDLNKRQVQKARATEEVVERELKIAQFNQQILLNESKLRQQQNLLEVVRSDRNLYRKTLIEQKNEMQEYKRKYSNLNMQIKQLKQEISDKDIGFVTEHLYLEHVKSDIAVLKEHNETSTKRTKEMDDILKNQSRQVRKLTTIIADADEEIRVQTKQYNAIVNEQRVLNQQLIKRNDELAVLYEQLKLQNSVLGKGSKHYEAKMTELRAAQASRDQLVNNMDEIMNDIGKYEELKSTIAHLEREMIQEQLKTRALSDELKKPINIHRWRRLMDTNTDTYGMITRVRGLQKQIISKSGQVETRDKEIQDKEKLYVDLRRVLARQPGSEAAEQLRLYAATLREKQGKFKQMKVELKMYQAKVYEYKHDLQKISQDLALVKLEYFSRRRSHMQQQQQNQSMRPETDEYGGLSGDDEEDEYMGTYQGYGGPQEGERGEGGGLINEGDVTVKSLYDDGEGGGSGGEIGDGGGEYVGDGGAFSMGATVKGENDENKEEHFDEGDGDDQY
jgi:chromosome segregation ATPase